MMRRFGYGTAPALVAIVLSLQLTRTLLGQTACDPPPSGLTSWWPANGTAQDVIGTNTGTLLGGATFSSGEVGSAFTFNGNGSYVQIPDSPSLSFTNDFSIELWYLDGGLPNGAYGGLIAKRPFTGACNFGLTIIGGNPGTLLIYLQDPNYGSYQALTYSGVPPAGAFHHLAATFHQATPSQIQLTAYIDGKQVQTNTITGNLSNTTNNVPVDIGCSNPNGEWFKGKIDEVSIYSRLLSASEIAAIYNAGSAGKCLQTAPIVFEQPTNQTVVAGSSVSFSAVVNGEPPLSYQWTMDGTNLPGATDTFLNLTNVQVDQSGTYALYITNSLGWAATSNALLTVNPPPACTPAPAGIVSWWPAEGDLRDMAGGNNGGVLTNGATFAVGEVGQSLVFNGAGSYVQIPDSPSLSFTNDFTIELWYKDGGLSAGAYGGLIAKRPLYGACNFGLSIVGGSPASLLIYLEDPKYGSYQSLRYQGLPPAGAFHHLAATFHQEPSDQIVLSAWVDGQLVLTNTISGNLARTTNNVPVDIGCSNPNGEWFKGNIDEVSIYGRVLSSTEIQSIYNSGSAGKCASPMPARVFLQPSDQTAIIGQTATFSATGAGTWPLSYQWFYNDTNTISGATNASLILTNVQMSQAGSYSVMVTNAYGSATSSNATLVVNFPPATVRVVGYSGTAGQQVTVPVVLVANGNENAVGFSVAYSATLLTNAGASVGSGAPGASFVVNPNQAGQIGIGVALPSGTTFAPGTQEVARISFVAAASATNFIANLTFGDQPTKRLISDAKANPLPANFVGGQVALARSQFEADVAPRPNGDGQVDIADWVQVGRFVAALDSPTNSSEFQRADCAPRDTLGDGLLTVSDWVQAGRYAAGLDAPTVAGGPTGPPAGGVVVHPLHKDGVTPQDLLSVQGPIVFQGQTATALVSLMAQGGENAVGFSLAFDPTVVTYISAGVGADTVNATMDINAYHATNGQIGVVLALPTGTGFSPGARQLVKVNFLAISAVSIDSTVSFTDTPVIRDVSNTNASSVATTYANGTISVNPRPSLAIAHSSQAINLAWPLWATNYNLQQAIGATLPATGWTKLPVTPVPTNNALNVTLPLTNSVQYYRLQHQ